MKDGKGGKTERNTVEVENYVALVEIGIFRSNQHPLLRWRKFHIYLVALILREV